jgi:hypothetical protein
MWVSTQEDKAQPRAQQHKLAPLQDTSILIKSVLWIRIGFNADPDPGQSFKSQEGVFWVIFALLDPDREFEFGS